MGLFFHQSRITLCYEIPCTSTRQYIFLKLHDFGSGVKAKFTSENIFWKYIPYLIFNVKSVFPALLLLKTQEFHQVFSPYGPHKPCLSKSIGVLEKRFIMSIFKSWFLVTNLIIGLSISCWFHAVVVFGFVQE